MIRCMDTHRSIEFHSLVFVYYDFDVDYNSLIDSYLRRSLYRIIYMIPFMDLVYSIIESAGVIYYFILLTLSCPPFLPTNTRG